MGVIISRFRKQKTTKEKLKILVKDIKEIEEFRQYTQKRQRDIVGRFVLFSVLIFIIAAVGFYFWALPEKTIDRVLYMIPFIFTPFLIVLLKRIISWYYSRKISRNEDRLDKLKEEKKKLLEDVMDNETYKTAKEILEQFAPEQLRSKEPAPTSIVPKGPTSALRSGPGGQPGALQMSQDIRRRILAVQPQQQQSPTPGWKALPPPSTPMTPFQSQRAGMPPGPPMPRSILPRERGVMDRLVEFIVGDGPSNRFALVCRQCASHNGMALQEEFEYLAFRCCYCFAWNPARKQRPQAPRLPMSIDMKQEEDGGESSQSTSEAEGEGQESQEKKEDGEEKGEEQLAEKRVAETDESWEPQKSEEKNNDNKEIETCDKDPIPPANSAVPDTENTSTAESESMKLETSS